MTNQKQISHKRFKVHFTKHNTLKFLSSYKKKIKRKKIISYPNMFIRFIFCNWNPQETELTAFRKDIILILTEQACKIHATPQKHNTQWINWSRMMKAYNIYKWKQCSCQNFTKTRYICILKDTFLSPFLFPYNTLDLFF